MILKKKVLKKKYEKVIDRRIDNKRRTTGDQQDYLSF